MVDILILVLFVVSGAAAGWLGVDLLPEQRLIHIQNLEKLSWILGGGGALVGLLAGVMFQRLRRRLMEQVRTMPTDLLVSRAVGLILGLLVANLLISPILFLSLPWELVLVKPMAAITAWATITWPSSKPESSRPRMRPSMITLVSRILALAGISTPSATSRASVLLGLNRRSRVRPCTSARL